MNLRRLISAIALLAIVFGLVLFSGSASAEPNCQSTSRITHDFENGARWDFCWESRIRENLVLSDVHYTPPGKEAFRVLSSGRLSQLHVAYDDDDVTYNDVTQYGLGGSYLQTLSEADCPNGELLTVQTRPALCLWQTKAENGFQSPTRAIRSASINVFSVSQVGAYAYIISWTFYDDGTFEPGVGATGALQRGAGGESLMLPFGRILQGDPDTLWLSHTHNYYWRLDFDLGDSATDDVVSEYRYAVDEEGRREQSIEAFTTEQARRIDPDAHLYWRVLDDSTNSGYQIEPTRNGHRYERKEVEPYTDYDFFVTVGNDCERFASQNARFNPDCLNHVLQYVDGQSVQNEDIVVWNRVSFHHTPRSEDQRHMHTHWDGFLIKPVNLLSGTSSLIDLPNTAPSFDKIPDMITAVGELVHADMIRAEDPDGDILSYSATGLPPGLGIRLTGHIHGYPLTEGTYNVQVTARDDHSESQSSFRWTIGSISQTERKKSGDPGILTLLVLMTMLACRSQIKATRAVRE